MTTSIEWTDTVWNPVTGCTKVSAGCKHCYAETIANRRLPGGGFTDRPFTEVRCHPERLDAPLHWRKPRRVFVNSMSDLFHEDIPKAFVWEVLNVCDRAAESRGHTFQILTKRPERMAEIVNEWWVHYQSQFCEPRMDRIWIGTSIENRASLDRLKWLRRTPAVVRFVSFEPLLEDIGVIDLSGIAWAIIGGESGPGARPFDIAWARSVVAQCRAAGVACFVKQVGAMPIESADSWYQSRWGAASFGSFAGVPYGMARIRLSDRKGGDMAEWPEDLRVREYPR